MSYEENVITISFGNACRVVTDECFNNIFFIPDATYGC